MEKEKLSQKLNRAIENIKPENRIGVIAYITVDPIHPQKVKVIVDRGERDVRKHGVYIDFTEKSVPTAILVKEGWRQGDFVFIGLLNTSLYRLGSPDELAELGIDLKVLSTRYFDWIGVHKAYEEKQTQQEYPTNSQDIPPIIIG